jgi:hypothetical protein
MGRLRTTLVAVVGAMSLVVGGGAVASAQEGGLTLLEFDSMTPVTGSAVGTANDRGIVGGGFPWVITSGSGELDRFGELHVQVTGLVIAVPPFNGINPVPRFGATVSCLTPHGVVNLRTATVPATMTGDATIDATVTLPHPCKDAIVFVTSPGGAWFAMSNAEDED